MRISQQIIAITAFLFGSSAAVEAQTDALPTAAQIVARYDQALGGEAAFRRHTSETMRGEVETADGKKLPFIYFAASPYLRLEKVSLPDNKGEVFNGFDGKIAWSLDPGNGAQISTGDDRESAKRDADFYYPLDELTWFKSMITVGVVNYEGKKCYHLHGINNWGRSNDHFYDVSTGLLAGYEFETPSPDGPRIVHQIFSDYRRIDGVLVPMEQTVKVKSKTGDDWSVAETLHYARVTFNDVDPFVFVPPQPVIDLAKKTN
jgi:hypothetical protein